MPFFRALVLLALALGCLATPAAFAAESPILWPEDQRRFVQDGPGWLLYEQEMARLFAADDAAERGELIAAFYADIADADASGELSEEQLAEAIERRRALVREELLTLADVRARLFFLHGPPTERLVIDCGLTFQPIEIWSYPHGRIGNGEDGGDEIVVYQPRSGAVWRLWSPYDGKRVLYTSEMEYFLEQWEEYASVGAIRGRRFDRQACQDSPRVDRATGVDGLTDFRQDRPSQEQIDAYLDPPADRALWARQALAGEPVDPRTVLELGDLTVDFPARDQQRLVARFEVRLPADARIEPIENLAEEQREEIRLGIQGLLEQDGAVFERLRLRYVIPKPEQPTPLALVFTEALRPGAEVVLRLRVHDEIGGTVGYQSLGFRVPDEPQETARPETVGRTEGEEEILRFTLGLDVPDARNGDGLPQEDSLLLSPPLEEVVLGMWRAEALAKGERIDKVVFSVDGEVQMTDGKPPYSAEVRLADFPVQQVVRAEGIDAEGRVVAVDEVILNQPRGAFEVTVTEPARGERVSGEITATAQVVVPLDREVEEVVFDVDGTVVATLTEPPWSALIVVPATEELSYLSVRARLDDGQTVEDVRFLNAPDYVEQLDVELVEIYATVVDRSDRPVLGLGAEEFTVRLDGQEVEIERFETTGVTERPLILGIALDASGSMESSLATAQEAARDFLKAVATPRDLVFALSFANRPQMLLPPTPDVAAAAAAIDGVRARGWTALHDAIVTSLYYFRSFPGQRALVVLTDGDDTRSRYSYDETLDYARRSGVAIYAIGLEVSALDRGVRGKVRELAEATGGQSFFIKDAAEISGVYEQIEQELRSRYFLGVTPPATNPDEAGDRYRRIEVDVAGRGRTVRTAQGAYQ